MPTLARDTINCATFLQSYHSQVSPAAATHLTSLHEVYPTQGTILSVPITTSLARWVLCSATVRFTFAIIAHPGPATVRLPSQFRPTCANFPLLQHPITARGAKTPVFVTSCRPVLMLMLALSPPVSVVLVLDPGVRNMTADFVNTHECSATTAHPGRDHRTARFCNGCCKLGAAGGQHFWQWFVHHSI